MNNPLRTEVFVSYSHRDDIWREELLYTLKPYLQRERTNISVWVDRDIKPGDPWDQEIRGAIARARVAVLLVSKYFLASDYIKNEELPLIHAMQEDGLRILWVPVSACMYTETELQVCQAVLDPSAPLDSRNTSEQSKALLKVCAAIRETFQNRPLAPEKDTQRTPKSSIATTPLEVTPATAADQSLAQGLLFCIMAVQNEWIDPVQLSKACSEWASDKSRSLPQILIERQWITSEDQYALDAMLQRSLSRHAGDAEKALLRSGGGVALQVVQQSQIPELQKSIDRLAKIAEAETPQNSWQMDSANRYQWLAVHAAGSFSQVYAGLDRTFNRPVALKTTHAQLSAPVALLHQRRLITEAQIAGQLEHPHIVPVYDLAKRDLDDEPFYAMRMLRGQTLADEIQRHHEGKIQGRCDTLERRRLIESLLCVCHAMEYAHARGVLHLDLKPQNVALGDYREVYLLDWGLSRPLRGPRSGTLETVTLDDTVIMGSDDTQGAIGTPGYMSPEQAQGESSRFDQRTDVYGLGAILYEILTSKPPHNEEDTRNDFENIRTLPVRPVREVADEVPPVIAAICDKALSFKVEDRQATVEDLSIELRRFLDDEPLLSYRTNVEQFEALLEQSPERHDFREGIARNLFNLGLIQNGMLRHAAAENSLNKALEHYKLLVEKFPRDPRLRSELAVVWLHLYYVLTDARKFETAEFAKRNALDEYQRLTKLSPSAGRHGYLESILSQLGGVNEDAESKSDVVGLAGPMVEVDNSQVADQSKADIAFLRELLNQESSGQIDKAVIWAAIEQWRELAAKNNSRPLRDVFYNVLETLQAHTITDSSIENEPSLNSPPGVDRHSLYSTQMFYATLAPALGGAEREFGQAVVGPRYRILRPFAQGGLGAIYVAYDEALHREVALKELRVLNETNSTAKEYFLREARITALLDHPGVVPIYSLGSYPDNRPFYAMRLVRGETLRDAIEHWHSRAPAVYSPQTPELRALLLHVVAVCKTIAFAHSRGVVHCDLKPANILIGHYGETLVIDWGLAKTIIPSSQPGMGDAIETGIAPTDDLIDGQLFGTLAYMSPEQAAGALSMINERSDVYSLGATLYHLLVGQPLANRHGSREDVIEARMNGELVAPRAINPSIPKALEAICLKAMSLRQEDRYSSASHLAEDLEKWLTNNSNWKSWFKR